MYKLSTLITVCTVQCILVHIVSDINKSFYTDLIGVHLTSSLGVHVVKYIFMYRLYTGCT